MWSPLVVMIMVSMAAVFQCDVAGGLKFPSPPPPPPRKPITVGGSKGWGWSTNSSLAEWVQHETIKVGDTLYFKYSWSSGHNVNQVNETGYNNCKTSKGDNLWASGNDYIKLNQKGWHYFICNYPGTCGTGDTGMKIKVDVK
ncbi:basic blue protein [Phtheirospermum japonicum]|uniref:Basic blue protein n=1 Tax=Phtheirospermum japonicum TaxID=374723 RepID=A0A830D210_9LAMI|nr:basic blue protein [Phtheirospermum japonicum]